MINMGYSIHFILCLIKGAEFGIEGLPMDFGHWKKYRHSFYGLTKLWTKEINTVKNWELKISYVSLYQSKYDNHYQ